MKRAREEEDNSSAADQINEMKANLSQVEALLKLDPTNADVLALKTQLSEALELLGAVDQDEDQSRSEGTVRFFNSQKGYGFISMEGSEDDIFMHHTQVLWQGEPEYKSVAEGRILSFRLETKESSGKLQAVDIRTVAGHPVVSDDAVFVTAVGCKTYEGSKEVNEDRYVSEQEFVMGSYFAVYDGHQGAECSKYLAKHLHKNVIHLYDKHRSKPDGVSATLSEAFATTDHSFLEQARREKRDDGSTALCVVIEGTTVGEAVLHCANVGDCRAVLCRDGQAIPLSEDHKPNRPDEKKRIAEAGGVVMDMNGVARVTDKLGAKGQARKKGDVPRYLAVSRAMGDLWHKTCGVISEPDVKTINVDYQDEFIVIASDGVWDVCSNQEVVDIVKSHDNAQLAAEAVVKESFDKGSQDNLTAIVVAFAAGHCTATTATTAAT